MWTVDRLRRRTVRLTHARFCLAAGLARVFDAAGQADSTIAAIETYLRTPMSGRAGLDAIYLGPFLKRFGDLHEATGEKATEATSYSRFIDLWKTPIRNSSRTWLTRVVASRS